MKLLVIGSGGREHALAWKLARSPRISRVLVAPGNAGTAREEGVVNAAAASIPEWIELARSEAVAFTVVGPEAPLAEGVVDAFHAEGLKIVGPTRAAARARPTRRSASLPRRTPTWSGTARPLSSRPTGWPPARAWWWPWTWARRARLSTAC
jgi:phosphoribosylamine--glycine ligase